MNLQKIQNYTRGFADYLSQNDRRTHLYKYESLKTFQDNWDLEAEDFCQMYDNCLRNSKTVRLWKADQYYPKKLMLLFGEMQPDYVRFAFRDLFNEEKEIEGRVDRFIFYCDELLKEYRNRYPLKVENNHYHNFRIISLYLAFFIPTNYTLYDFDLFKNTLLKLGSRNIPAQNDIERYFKVTRTLWKFLMKERETMDLHLKSLDPHVHYTGESLLLVEEFCFFICHS